MANRALGVLMVFLSGAAAAAPPPEAWQTLASVRAAAEEFLRARHDGAVEAAISTRALDERLRLTRCATPLKADAPNGLRDGRGTVRVRCDGPRPWKLFVPVAVTRRVPVVIARRPLLPGAVIAAADLAVEERADTLLPRDFVSEPEALIGLTARRSIARGNPVTRHQVNAGRLIRRGQRVVLVTQRRGVFVKSDGVALADAGRSQRVAVKTRAGRVVDGIVRDAATVEVAR